jgi:hypothetical protein
MSTVATDILLVADDGSTMVLDARHMQMRDSVNLWGGVQMPIQRSATPPREGEVRDAAATRKGS